MLIELKVSNFAIIENLHIQFKKGLNILSGETGAGKSVLLKSLSLMMGLKASTESIRTGAPQASIEGSFDISKRADIIGKLRDLGIECEDQVLIVRRVLAEDKSRVYLNGTLSTLQNLREMVAPLIEVAGHSAPLIELTGQHENRNLLSTAYHLDLLDQYAGVWELRKEFQTKFSERNRLMTEVQKLRTEAQAKEQRLDFLRFQRDEIKALDLSPSEEESLELEINRLKGASKLEEFIEQAESALSLDDDSALARIQRVAQKGTDLLKADPEFAKKANALSEAKSLIEDFLFEIRRSQSQLENNSEKLESLQQRLSGLRKLQKKYGRTISDILEHLTSVENEISLFENSDAQIEKLQNQTALLEKELETKSLMMSKKRNGSMKLLQDSVNAELMDLNMKGVTFHVQISRNPSLTGSGYDVVEFMSQTSPKDEPKSLGKFASGGELSRILLALKRVVGSSEQPRTYLFDEVDTGVSGPTAEKVGKKLRAIAKGQQVICITHLPQVAACGDHHYYIQKSPQKGAVNMDVTELSDKERVHEIARLISGEKISKTSLAHAEALLR